MRGQLCVGLILLLLLAGPGLAQKKPVAKPAVKASFTKAQAGIKQLQKQISVLKARLAKAKKKQLKADILDKIDLLQAKLAKLKAKIAPQKKSLQKPITRRAATDALASLEAGPEEQVHSSPEAEVKPRSRFRHEVGVTYGFFAGLTSVLGEVRVPLRIVFGPATVNFRLATGLAQGRVDGRRFVPVNLDLIFSFPPGWFTGVENYLGCGLNYVALTSGMKQGTVGGEVYYGVESEGFGGTVYGELGYAIVQTGFSPSYKGMTVLLGYRLTFGN
ncbi:MAG: hypothetical protein WC632_05890 [Candidatus Margulisiibacteriota bacterium]